MAARKKAAKKKAGKKKASRKAAPNKKKTSKRKTKKGRAPSATSIGFEMLKNPKGAKKLLEELQLDRPAVQRLRKALKGEEKMLEVLEKYREAQGFAAFGEGRGAGRKLPEIGETHKCKVQQGKTGGPYLRVPANTLGLEKGDYAEVTFNKGSVTAKG